MDSMFNQDLAALIKEISSPLISAENMHTKMKHLSTSQPPSYETVHETETKQPVDGSDLEDIHTTQKKFTDTSSESEDSESDTDNETDVKSRYPIKDKASLLKQIENLQKEQEALKKTQEIHEQHIKELLKCEIILPNQPSVSRRFKSLRKSYTSDEYSTLFSKLRNISTLFPSTNKQENSPLTDEHIYVQLEQIYTNFHVLHFPSKTAQNILNGRQNCSFYDTSSMIEITALRNRVKALESELEMKSNNNNNILMPSDQHIIDDSRPSAMYSKLRGIAGRPSSPLPIPPAPKNLCPVEVTFKWTISNYSEKLRREIADAGLMEISNPFYLTHCGYRAQIEAYLNGNGTGTNKCMSVFLRIIKGDYDQHLKWPVNLHLVLILVNQSDNHCDSLKAMGNQFQYNKPSGSSVGESDCWGLIEFASHEMTRQRRYIYDDKIVLKCRVQIL